MFLFGLSMFWISCFNNSISSFKFASLFSWISTKESSTLFIFLFNTSNSLIIFESSKEVAVALKEQHGIEVDKKKISLDDAIRTVGTSIVTVKLHREVSAKLTVKVREA